MSKKIKMQVIEITPDKAACMLEKNTRNRPLDNSRVKRYTDAIKDGKWKINGECIIISPDGTILDGQHRLWAIIESRKAVEMCVMFNVDEETIATINCGKSRGPGDVLSINGHHNTQVMAPTVRLAYIYDVLDNNMIVRKSVPVTNDVIAQYAEHLMPHIAESVEIASCGAHLFNRSVMAFCHLVFMRSNQEKAEEFIHLIKTGESLASGHPVLALRAKLLDNRISGRKKLSVREEIALYFKAWNVFYRGKSIMRLSWNPENEAFPEVR